jgi:ABC-type amino acid transport substrate-binding protein
LRIRPAVAAALLLIGGACERAQLAREIVVDPNAPPLRFCLEDNDAPRSRQKPESGFDWELMSAVAARAGRRYEVVWIPSDPKIIELEESTFPIRTLRRGRCDALASIPGAAALGEDADAVILSRPYSGGGFELVAAEAIPPDLFALRGKRVSVLSVSVAHMAAVALGMDWNAKLSAQAQLDDLDSGNVVAALVFGPSLAGLSHNPRQDFEIPEALRWNFHVATRRGGDAALAAAIDRALVELVDDGTVAELLERYDIPVRAPYPSTSTRASVRALQDAAPAGGG